MRETYAIVVPIEKRGGGFRYRARLDLPSIAGGAGAITHVDVRIGRRYRAGGKAQLRLRPLQRQHPPDPRPLQLRKRHDRSTVSSKNSATPSSRALPAPERLTFLYLPSPGR